MWWLDRSYSLVALLLAHPAPILAGSLGFTLLSRRLPETLPGRSILTAVGTIGTLLTAWLLALQ
jgi:hypothetical protein